MTRPDNRVLVYCETTALDESEIKFAHVLPLESGSILATMQTAFELARDNWRFAGCAIYAETRDGLVVEGTIDPDSMRVELDGSAT